MKSYLSFLWILAIVAITLNGYVVTKLVFVIKEQRVALDEQRIKYDKLAIKLQTLSEQTQWLSLDSISLILPGNPGPATWGRTIDIPPAKPIFEASNDNRVQ